LSKHIVRISLCPLHLTVRILQSRQSFCLIYPLRLTSAEYPSAASSLLEGLDEMFTINRLGLPKTLRRCLGSTNVIESPNSGIRSRTRRVKNWQDHAMVIRWVAASLLDMEKRFKRTMGYQQLWMLEAKLKDLAENASVDRQSRVA